MVLGSLGLAFLAGLLSILSPCVLPLLPIVLGSAATEHRFGPLALAAGVALSFVAVGLFVATIGYGLGLDADVFRNAAAILMIAVGGILAIPPLQVRLAAAGGPVSDWAERNLSGFSTQGISGQFGVGLLLGAVWAPCVGPTLGAASVLAAQGESLGQVAGIMTAFGFGAAIPLMALGLMSRQAMLRWRQQMLQGGKTVKILLGIVLIVVGLLIVSGYDKAIEAELVSRSPAWLVNLTTRF